MRNLKEILHSSGVSCLAVKIPHFYHRKNVRMLLCCTLGQSLCVLLRNDRTGWGVVINVDPQDSNLTDTLQFTYVGDMKSEL